MFEARIVLSFVGNNRFEEIQYFIENLVQMFFFWIEINWIYMLRSNKVDLTQVEIGPMELNRLSLIDSGRTKYNFFI